MNVISGEVGTNILKSDANAGRELPEGMKSGSYTQI